MRKFIASLFFTLILFSGNSQTVEFTPEELEWIEQHPIVEFGYTPSYEPYEIYMDGVYTGIVGEYIDKIEEVTGIDMVPLPDMTWEKSLKMLKSGEIKMVSNCAQSEDRKKFLVFTEPILFDPIIIASRMKSPYIHDVTDLNNRKVACPKNYWTNDLLRKEYPNIQVVDRATLLECLEALSYEEVDAVVGNLGVISYLINKNGFNNLKVAAPAKFADIEISMAFAKDWTIFRDICQKVINTVSLQERNEIRNHWISVRYEYSFSWQKTLIGLVIILGIALLGFGLFYLWNRSLQRQIEKRIRIHEKMKVTLNEVRKSDQEKEVLLQEIHHRIKNNLQIITSLLRLQALDSNDSIIEQSLNEATERIQAIALIHETIYDSSRLDYISAKEYIETLSSDIIRSFRSDTSIKEEVNVTAKDIGLKAIVPIALILNELITNSLKYAFRDLQGGTIEIKLVKKKNKLHLHYSDNGKWLDNADSKNFGTSLLSIFTDQLNGEYELKKEENGTFYHFVFSTPYD